ncbi:MAG: hypothetical protein ACO2ON_01610 [Candidatus Nanopusillus sp.]
MDILNIILLALITFYIIYVIFIKIKKKNSEIGDYVVEKIAELFVIMPIPIFVALYSLTQSTVLLYLAVILGMALLFIEGKTTNLHLLKEIKNNTNKHNLEKLFIKLFMNILPFALSVMILYSLLLLIMFPLNIVLIDTVLMIMPLLIVIIMGNIMTSILMYNNIKRQKQQINH